MEQWSTIKYFTVLIIISNGSIIYLFLILTQGYYFPFVFKESGREEGGERERERKSKSNLIWERHINWIGRLMNAPLQTFSVQADIPTTEQH